MNALLSPSLPNAALARRRVVAAPPKAGESLPISIAELVSHRPYLVRFALRKLRDPALAEDAVHDVIEAVLSGRAHFAGRAALRSWLTAVLKNKIVDALRRSSRHEALDDDDGNEGAGHGVACPQPRPDEIAEQRQALARALAGIERLPATLREAMRLRIVEDRTTESVCAELGISEENLFVRVHRARKQLLS
ncbi:MAG: sigma-70 family RNA polymerase sigma factor [Pseudomonadota bacterium]|nr:sigma-70 family RNA polymerase sigma factor [Pseudomonadota bacterium]